MLGNFHGAGHHADEISGADLIADRDPRPGEARELLLPIAQYSGYPRAALIGIAQERIAEVPKEGT